MSQPAIELDNSFMVKLKQIVVAIPNSELIMKGRYKEVFETKTFEEFLLKMVAAAREFMASPDIDNETKFNLFFSYHYYVDLLCESIADKFVTFTKILNTKILTNKTHRSISVNQRSMLSQLAPQTMPLPSSTPKEEVDQLCSPPENLELSHDSANPHSSLLEKIASANEQQLNEIFDIVNSQNSEWCVDVDISTLSDDAIERISALFSN